MKTQTKTVWKGGERFEISMVTDGSTGTATHSHAVIDASGSVKGMKNLGYWKKGDRVVKAWGSWFNLDQPRGRW
jgi:hypothetical protein